MRIIQILFVFLDYLSINLRVMKTLKLTSVVLLLAIFVCGCQSDFDNDELTVLSQENKGTRSDIVLEVLMPSVTTRGIYNLDVFEGIEGLENTKRHIVVLLKIHR